MEKKRRVLLVGWDAADWKVISPLVDMGLMPHVGRLVENGVMGNLATLQPPLSPMLWTSIATGKRPLKHGIHGFSEPDPHSGTVRPITNLSRKTKAVWNILNQTGHTSLVVGWWPSAPAEPIRGAMVSNHFQQAVAPLGKPWPLRAGTVYPPEFAADLAHQRLHPHELDGDLLRHFIPKAPEIDQEKDKRLGTLAKLIAECTGIHWGAMHLFEKVPDWDFAAVYFDAIDHFSHGFMQYHPPRLEWVNERDFELYKDVVNSAYCYHDLMLGRLLQLAGPETTVILVSDHGFHPDHLRPKSVPNEPAGPAAEHRDYGIFVASGPGIKKDELVFGASLLDIAPTLLSLFGLPVGRDMDGRPLLSIYEATPEIEYFDSWDSVPGEDGRHPPDTQIDPVDAQEAIRQLVDLGYIDEPSEDAAEAIAETTRELQYNLARSCVDGGQVAHAAAIFEELWETFPDESRFGVHLLQTYLQRKMPIEARATLTKLRERKREAMEHASEKAKAQLAEWREKFPAPADAPANAEGIDWEKLDQQAKRRFSKLQRTSGVNLHTLAYLEGSVLALEGRHEEAIETLALAEKVQTNNRPSLLLKQADVFLRTRDWPRAEAAFRAVVDLDPMNAHAHFGLARVAFRRRDWQAVVSEAQTTIGQFYTYGPAHHLLGLALWKLGNTDDAFTALSKAVDVNPIFPLGHRSLARFYRLVRRDLPASRRHQHLAREARQVAPGINSPLSGTAHLEEIRDRFRTSDGDDTWTPSKAPHPLPPRAETVVVVTGLPRSGTSMMMQMLAAGGVPAFADDHRPADESNERGYLEHTLARRLAVESSWVTQARGQAVKVVAQLVPHLPRQEKYRVVMMHRPLGEIIASQKKMLGRLGKDGGRITDEALAETFARQVNQVRSMLVQLRKEGIVDVLDVKYHDVLESPATIATRLATFLGAGFDATKAAAAVDPSLRHERA
jgi:predicted AlkP superfamily phosphohydrolase/phosphomutase/tetratricopeptide (TPR) repeat protein